VGPRDGVGRREELKRYRIFSTLVRLPLGIACFVAVALVLIPLALARPTALHRAARTACRVILRALGVRVHVEGQFPSEGTFIVMFNHTSFIDMFLAPVFLRGRYTAVMAEERMRYPLLQPLLRRFKVVPILRENPEQAMAALQRAKEALRAGWHVAILPEGTRTTTGALLPFKSGGFHMAVQTGAPILPVGIAGAFEYKPKDRWTIAPGLVRVRIGAPTRPEEYAELGPSGLKDRVRSAIEALVESTPEPT
jgi:1-acyl-sn-glycerol-3-phosphate acyltransferase